MEEFEACFSDLEDPRDSNARHNLLEILLIAQCTMLCGGEDCTDMALFGRADSTGSDRAKVLKKITEAKKLDRLAVKISRAGEGVRITIPAGDLREKAAVWLAVFDNRHDTEIKRGENSGQILRYHNVVRGMTQIGAWTGRPLDIVTKAGDMPVLGRDSCAVIVQSLKTGRILGAARLDLKKN